MGIEELVVKHRLERDEIAAAHRRIALVLEGEDFLVAAHRQTSRAVSPGTSGLQLAWRFSHSITSSALPGHPPFAERVLRNIPPGSRGSLGLEVDGVDHLSPLLGFF